MLSNRAPPHEAATSPARNYDRLGDLGRQTGRTTKRGAVATRQALDPIRLPLAELLHIVIFVFLQEVDGRVRVLQNVEGRDVVVLAAQLTTVITAMASQTCRQGRFRAAHIHMFATRRGDAVDAP